MTIINIGMCYQAEVLLKNKRKPSVVNVFTSILCVKKKIHHWVILSWMMQYK
jgi:hypothetical protein